VRNQSRDEFETDGTAIEKERAAICEQTAGFKTRRADDEWSTKGDNDTHASKTV